MGVQINGDTGNISATKADYSGNVTIGGTLTYEDVTNVDSVGIITARSNILVGSGITLSPDGDIFFTGIMTGNGSGLTNLATDLVNDTSPQLGGDLQSNGNDIDFADNDKAIFGTDGDLEIYHNNVNGIIENQTGDLLINPKVGERAIECIADGEVSLYHDNSKKLETASGGVTVTGTVAATSFTGSGAALTGISAGVLAMQLRLDGTRGSYTETITSGNSFTSGRNLSGLSITMTPTNATTIFLITGNIYVTHSPSYMGKGFVTTEISGGSEQVIAGNGDNNHRATFPISDAEYGTGWTGTGKNFTLFYDHNTTSAVTFRVRVATTHGGYPVKYNQDGENNTTDNDGVSMISSFMVQEIDSSIFTGTDNANIYRGT